MAINDLDASPSSGESLILADAWFFVMSNALMISSCRSAAAASFSSCSEKETLEREIKSLL